MRIDRLLTLRVVQPLHKIGLGPRAHRLPILMYHSISNDWEAGVAPYFRVCTSPRRFAEQMQWLAELGYRGVTLSEGLAWLTGGEAGGQGQRARRDGQEQDVTRHLSHVTSHSVSPSAKLVAITFDDGFRDFYTEAFPVLQHHGFSATVYLPTAFIGDDRRVFKTRDCLTWGEVKQLSVAGIEFGSHTVSHPKLIELSWANIESELRDSRAMIEQQLGGAMTSFAYPFAFPKAHFQFTHRFRDMLLALGYRNCVTTSIGHAHTRRDFFDLPRLPVNSVDDQLLLEAKLDGAYGWLAGPQYLQKHFARWLRRSP